VTNLHHGAKTPVCVGTPSARRLLHKVVDQRLGLIGGAAATKSGGGRAARWRTAGCGMTSAPFTSTREIHLAGVVFKHAQMGDLVSQPLGFGLGIAVFHAGQNAETRAAFAPDLAFNRYRSMRDALND
jgi:hypothetical protein